MPRVSKRTRMRHEVKRPMRCAAGECVVSQQRDGDREIRRGDEYFTWARKSGRSGTVYFQHVECGSPKRSQLSSRKTVAIEDAIDEAQKQLGLWVPELEEHDGRYELAGDTGDVESALSDVASVARDVGQEYQDAFDNMPEGLNQGDTGQALESVAQELDTWADDLEQWSAPTDSPDLPDRDEGESDDDFYDRCEVALNDWADEVRTDAEEKMGEMPEYQG